MQSSKGSEKVPLIIPASRWGSLGDHAAVEGLVTVLGQCNIAKRDENDQWCGPTSMQKYVDPKTDVYYIGADVIDGTYSYDRTIAIIDYCKKAALDGNSVTICGFSYSSKADPRIAGAIYDLPDSVRFVARDVFSGQRFGESTNRNFCIGADPAFLLDPDDELPEYVVESLSDEGQTRIGFNANQLIGESPDFLRRSMANNDYLFYLIPHDIRGAQNDDRIILQNLLSLVPERDRNRAIVTWSGNSCLSPSQVKALCGYMNIVITKRMHVAIASLGVGTPCITSEYNEKMKGCFQHFKMMDHVVEEISTKSIELLLDAENPTRNQIEEYADHVISLAKNNVNN